jgi:hypothetical protein
MIPDGVLRCLYPTPLDCKRVAQVESVVGAIETGNEDCCSQDAIVQGDGASS